MTPADAVDYLYALPRFAGVADDAYRPGLERMAALMEAMGRPHAAFPSVHVAGTNGKGSTASMIAAIATASGQRVGLHTSPHLAHVTERMRIDGTSAPEAWLAEAVARYRSDFERIGPSFFEATVALSFLYFAEQHVNVAVVEVGLGGRLDATNLLQPELAVITSVDLEHTALLGDTLPAIAQEKAGIIKRGVPVLTGVHQPEARAVIRDGADARHAPLHVMVDETNVAVMESVLDRSVLDVETPVRRYERLQVGLGGMHQQQNALLALRAAELLDFGEEAIRWGLRDVGRLTGLRGRLEVLQRDPLVVVDVAHNPSSLKATLEALRPARTSDRGHLHVLLGLMRDKDLDAIAALLREAGARVIPVALPSERALSAEALHHRLAAHDVDVRAPAAVTDAWAAFRRSATDEDILLATGSHQLMEPVLRTARRTTSPVRDVGP